LNNHYLFFTELTDLFTGGCTQCPVGKFKISIGDGGCLLCDLVSVPELYWEWLPTFPPFSGVESQCKWRCLDGFHQVAASNMSIVSCLPCTERPTGNPCSLGQFWDQNCNSVKDSGCSPCTGMLGEGVWTSNSNWTSSNCPYSCKRGYYDYNAGKGVLNYLQPNCTKCSSLGLNMSRACGFGSAFGQWLP
jgi:hypothetical protein